MNENLKRLIYIFSAFLLIIVILIAIFKYDLPEYTLFNNDYKNFLSAKTQVDALNNLSNQLNSLNLNIQTIQQNAAILNIFLPQTPEQENLIAIISDIGQKANVNITSMSFNTSNPASQGGSSNEQILAAQNTQSLIKPTTNTDVDLSISGTYDSIKNFISNVESSARLIDLTNLALSVSKTGTFNGSLKLRAYSQ